MFPSEVEEQLGYYVYAYVDPRDEQIFYVGKGYSGRAFHHLSDPAETRKTQRIAEIRAAGLSPRIDILVYGLSEAEALRVEAVCIDLIGLGNLTNLVTGHKASWGGRRPADVLVEELAAPVIRIEELAVAFSINQTYRYSMTPDDLYDATRGIWRLAHSRASKATIALAVYRGVIKEVYEIRSWHPAGTTPYARRDFSYSDLVGKLEFAGVVAPDALRSLYRGKRIQGFKLSQAGFQYLNF